jgi:hypothetical protein
MFDYYQPHSALACPMCGKPLGEWQGKEGLELPRFSGQFVVLVS